MGTISTFASRPVPVSLVVTTYGIDTRYTQLCIEKIATWKSRHHELIVVVHDPSAMLRLYLEYMTMLGVINQLVYAPSRYGHVAGVNLGFQRARNGVVFNINTDIRVGAGLVDRCADRLMQNRRVGMIGWHYNWGGGHDATRWRNGKLEFTLRTRESKVRKKGFLDKEHGLNIQSASWNTGRIFSAVGERRILCANTSFFGIRKTLWNRIGGFDVERYPHYWSDDYLCYAVLELGYDIENLAEDVRCSQRPDIFESLSDHKYQGIPEPEKFRDTFILRPGPDSEGQAIELIGRFESIGARSACLVPGSKAYEAFCNSGRVIARFRPKRTGDSVHPNGEFVILD